MTIANRWPRVGDEAVELIAADQPWRHDRVGPIVTVTTITQTLVITGDNAKYNRDGLFPVNEGRQSARRLVPANDDRVLCVLGRNRLNEVATIANSLARLDRKDPMDIIAALAQIISMAADARRRFIALTADASKAEQESDR